MAECPGKKSWPELVGKNEEDAAAKIEQENHGVRAIVLLEGSATTRDRRCDRVWVWINERGVVTRVPRVG
ncbi:proteinase inhibitor-like [Pyrus ussuriensis x Pyrus communis]|uniref:Proteinase inhibitor-like n=1 Tax=Pyrus ussuriensis x Pyrus communis TaxID=2448454 RepID=A0A5N5IP35_9ROSA|nr:proteinase inhibitor-like [Pyrus ussuriensis x Pyrus communis]